MIATDASGGSLKRLCSSSDSDDRSLLFKVCHDSMKSILSYLGIGSICRIDISVSNTTDRIVWLAILSANDLATFNQYEHCEDSIRWLEKRGIRLQRLKIKDRKWETDRINGSTLLGLDISSLQYINLQRCSIADEEVFSIAHGCPHLIELCLFGCDGVTDASLIVLGRCCRQLISLDIGECELITDAGLEGCSLLRNIKLSACEEITDMGLSAISLTCPLLTAIDLSHCMQITDMGISAIAQSCPLLSRINIPISVTS